MSCLPFLTVFWPLHGEQCCTFFTIHISMVRLLLGPRERFEMLIFVKVILSKLC